MKRDVRKIQFLPLTDEAMITLLRMIDIKKVLPKDAKILGAHYDPTRACWLAKIQSKTFDIVKEGEKIPELSPLEVTNV